MTSTSFVHFALSSQYKTIVMATWKYLSGGTMGSKMAKQVLRTRKFGFKDCNDCFHATHINLLVKVWEFL